MTYKEIKLQAKEACEELLKTAMIEKGEIFVVGCSSSEVKGEHIGKGSDINIAKAIYEGIKPLLDERGIFLAAQCCEHLNRAIIVEKEALPQGAEICNVVPQLHAGGSFSVTFYGEAKEPIAVEHIKAAAGMDIGDTLIGMHLRDVPVPVRTKVRKIGQANVVCARTRPKFIGGARAVYDDSLSGGEVRQ